MISRSFCLRQPQPRREAIPSAELQNRHSREDSPVYLNQRTGQQQLAPRISLSPIGSLLPARGCLRLPSLSPLRMPHRWFLRVRILTFLRVAAGCSILSILCLPAQAGKSAFTSFCTTIHTFAQTFPPISIDAKIRFHYLPHQIEPGSLILYGSV